MREYKYFTCDECGRVNPDFLAFGVGDPTRLTYCLNHIPRMTRMRMWIQEAIDLWWLSTRSRWPMTKVR